MLFMVIVLGFLLQIKTLFRTIFSPQNSRLVSLVPKSKYTTYNMSGRVISDVQTRAEDDRLYVRYNTDANIVYSTCDTNGCKRSHSSKILEIGMILGEKMLYFDFRCHIVKKFNKRITATS